ncbi:hypothetical protein FZW96_11915 [Bacillus sp. BGMRC 2118]|nr:hypothetical protein FZW96_11915 [Bacillus sp. BGMRC 2118]
MTRNSVENPMLLKVPEEGRHFAIDAVGTEIHYGDTFYLINDELVHEDNLEDFVIEFLGAKVKVAGEE